MGPEIHFYSHSFNIRNPDKSLSLLIFMLAKEFTTYTLRRIGKRFIREPKSVFGSANFKKTSFRFHINQYDFFQELALNNHVDLSKYKTVRHRLYKPTKVNLKLASKKELREYQHKVTKYIQAEGSIKVVTMQAGSGKTFTTNHALSEIGERFMVKVIRRYFDQWKKCLIEEFGFKPGELICIDSKKHLVSVMNMALAGELTECKAILISSNTYQGYLGVYENGALKEMGYPIKPINFYEKLGIGVRVIDEAHQFFHLNFKMDTYAHIPKTVYLSATLDPDDKTLQKAYEVMFPRAIREDGGFVNIYINVQACKYRLRPQTKIKWKDFNGSYNHHNVEQSIIKDKIALNNYLKMIFNRVKDSFLSKYEKGMTCLIFASSREMCRIISEYLNENIEDLNIKRYVGEDDFSVLMDNDIVVTTIGSAGTAIDKPNLVYVLQTNTLASSQGIIQLVFRIRPIPQYPNFQPLFDYFTCLDLERNVHYDNERRKILKPKIKSFNEIQLSEVV